MKSAPWQAAFQETLSYLQDQHPAPRIALVGVGHELRGDDAAGLHFVRCVAREKDKYSDSSDLLLIEAGAAPENFSGLLRRYAPHLVIMVDAALLDAKAGDLCWLPWQDTTGLSASTHTLPLKLLGTFLNSEIGCQIALLGIQPANLVTGASITPQVARAVEDAAQTWLWILFRFEQDLKPV